ncbi:MAG: hypothetical protein R3Y47_07470 [Lachnospiraceae bacterium]
MLFSDKHELLSLYNAISGKNYDNPDDIQLELSVIVLNVNEGYNKELMEKCKRLREYTYFVAAVRRNLKKHDIETATELAIEG